MLLLYQSNPIPEANKLGGSNKVACPTLSGLISGSCINSTSTSGLLKYTELNSAVKHPALPAPTTVIFS